MNFSWSLLPFFGNLLDGPLDRSSIEPVTYPDINSTNNPFLSSLPAGYGNLSAVLIKDNLAVLPGEWKTHDISKSQPYLQDSTDSE